MATMSKSLTESFSQRNTGVTVEQNRLPPVLQEAIRASTLCWQTDLEELFRNAKDRFPDVVWELNMEDGGGRSATSGSADKIWGHKGLIYARAPPSFQSRYFMLSDQSSLLPIASPGPDPDGGDDGTMPPLDYVYVDLDKSRKSLAIHSIDDSGTGELGLLHSRSPSPQRQHSPLSRGGSPAPSTCTDDVLRLATSRELFSSVLEYLYTASGLSHAFEFLHDQEVPLRSSTSTSITNSSSNSNEGKQHEIMSTHVNFPSEDSSIAAICSMPDENRAQQLDKLRKDLVYMWHSRLYSDVKIKLMWSKNAKPVESIFSSHRFMLVSRCEYFRIALKDRPMVDNPWRQKMRYSGGDEGNEEVHQTVTLTLPSSEFTPASLHFTLGYIYTGTLDFSQRAYDLSTALTLLRSARYLKLDVLYDEIQARIIQEMMHDLGCAYLSSKVFEMIGGTQHPPPLCLCKPCLRRAPRILQYVRQPDFENVYFERGARRVLVGGFGKGWCTQEFASLPTSIHTSLLKSLRKRTSSHFGGEEGHEGGRWRPGNVFAILWSAEEGLRRLTSLSISNGENRKGEQEWIETVRELVLKGRTGCDEVLGAESWACFHVPLWDDAQRADTSTQNAYNSGGGRGGEHVNHPPSYKMHHAHNSMSRNYEEKDVPEMGDWEQLMHSDGARFEDREKVKWVLDSVKRGLSQRWAGKVYETLMSQILLYIDPQHQDRALLGHNSMIRMMVEELRADVLRYIRKKWPSMVSLRAFDELEGQSLKEISDHIEVPIVDLLSLNVPSGEQHGTVLNVESRREKEDLDSEPSMQILPLTPNTTSETLSIMSGTTGRSGIKGETNGDTPPLCMCQSCVRRASSILQFTMKPDVDNIYLERGARRMLVSAFGVGWVTQEFASLPLHYYRSLVKTLRRKMTDHSGEYKEMITNQEKSDPRNVFKILWGAEQALKKLTSLGSSVDAYRVGEQNWIEKVRELVLEVRALCDEVFVKKSRECFHIPVQGQQTKESINHLDMLSETQHQEPSTMLRPDSRGSGTSDQSDGDEEQDSADMKEWEQLMHSDGAGNDDREKVDWVFASVRRGLDKNVAESVYETVVSQILLHPHPNHPDRPLLGQGSMIKGMAEELRLDVLRYIRTDRQRNNAFALYVSDSILKGKLVYSSDMRSFDDLLTNFETSDSFTALKLYSQLTSRCWEVLSMADPTVINAESVRAAIIDDVKSVIHMIMEVVEDRHKYRSLIECRGEDAESLLDLMQDTVDLVEDIQFSRSALRKALLRLSKTSGCHPRCMTIANIRLSGNHPIAGGSFADVWKGEISSTTIAVKVIRVFGNSNQALVLQAFLREALIWRQLSHPNLLPFYGLYRMADDRLCLISPWMENGNIVEFLSSNPDARRFDLAYDVAQGVAFLHHKNVIHADLKGVNILVNPNYRACIADFGLSNLIESKARTWSSLDSQPPKGGTARWQAPELFHASPNTFESDLYALASVFYEIFVGHHPYIDCPNDMSVMMKVASGMRPERSSNSSSLGLTDNVWSIMKTCWSQEPSDRGTAKDVVAIFVSDERAKEIAPAPDWVDVRLQAKIRHGEGEYPLCPSVDDIRQILKLN